MATEEAASDIEEEASEDLMSNDSKGRQHVYDQRRQRRSALLHEQRLAPPDLNGLLYESDFDQTRQLMPERDSLATKLF